MKPSSKRPAAGTGPGRGLAARIFWLTVGFVLLGEILIFVPSIARFQTVWFKARLDAAYIAALAGQDATPATEARLLDAAMALAITVRYPEPAVTLGPMLQADRTIDCDEPGWVVRILDAFKTLTEGGRTLRLVGTPPVAPGVEMEVLVDEAPLAQEMRAYGVRILVLSLVLSLIVALLLFLALRRLIVRPLAAMTGSITRFRDRPEDAGNERPPFARRDEIGLIDRELTVMRAAVRASLRQKSRLAALGEAVSRINHDLRALLATAVLVSDPLEASPDPEVRRTARRLFAALERATRLCEATLDLARQRPPTPRFEVVHLRPLIDEALIDGAAGVAHDNRLDPTLNAVVDRDQLYRVFLNLARNARRAMPEGGRITVSARIEEKWLVVEVADTGGGVPETIRNGVFRPFVGTSDGGVGMGLAICRDILQAHGGDIELASTDTGGTTFRLRLPRPEARAAVA